MSRAWLLVCVLMFTAAGATTAKAQPSRKSVSGSEATGTFSQFFTGKHKGFSSDIMILALGRGKLRVEFHPIFPTMFGKEAAANSGEAAGEATIVGNKAVFKLDEFGPCTITIIFTRPGRIDVSQDGSPSECGFGMNVSADGTYKKVSSKKPKFTVQ